MRDGWIRLGEITERKGKWVWEKYAGREKERGRDKDG